MNMTENKKFVVHKFPITFNQIIFDSNTHKYCQKPLKNKKPCPAYDNNYACPPYSPSAETTKTKLSQFKRFEIIIYELNLIYRIQQMKESHPDWDGKKAEQNALNSHLYNGVIYWGLRKELVYYTRIDPSVYVLANSSCRLCGKGCAAKTREPCRHPDKRLYSMEAAGINVHETLKPIENGKYELEWPPKTKACQVALVCFKQSKTITDYF